MIQDVIVTSTDLHQLQKDIHVLYRVGYDQEVTQLAQIKSQIHPEIFQAIESMGSNQSPAQIMDRMEELLNWPVIRIKLAFEPDASLARQIGHWCRQLLDDKLIFEYVLAPEILGGTQIEWGGRWHDYSLNTTIDEVIKARYGYQPNQPN